VIVYGKTTQRMFRGTSPIDIGAPDRQLNSVVAFAPKLPPALAVRNPSGKTTIQMKPAVKVPLKVWVLCVNADCDRPMTDADRQDVNRFLVLANEFFERQNTGLQLAKASADWVSDQTGPASATKRRQFKNFRPSGDLDCKPDRLEALKSGMFQPNALNLYMVGRVDNQASSGESCLERNIAVVAAAASWHTQLHELGHNLGLQHADGLRTRGEPISKNLMFSRSLDRDFIWPGQMFQVFFDIGSLRAGFPALVRGWPGLDCTAEGACLPLRTHVWDESK